MISVMTALEDESQRRKVEQWYLKYYGLMLTIAVKIVNDYELANDMVNEAFIRIIRNYKRITKIPEAELSQYFIAVVRSTSLDYLRKKDDELIFENGFMESDGLSDQHSVENDVLIKRSRQSAEGTCIEQLDLEVVVDAMDKLSDVDRDYIIARHGYGLSDLEISKSFGVKREYVHTYIKRACIRLRRILKEEGYID